MVVDLPSLSSLTIGTGAFSNTHHFDIHQFPNLISLSLGYDIIDREDSFELNGLSKLTEFRCLQPIYRNSPVETNETKSFRIINCSALKDIYVSLVVLLIMDNSRCQIVLLSFLLLLPLFGCMFLLL